MERTLLGGKESRPRGGKLGRGWRRVAESRGQGAAGGEGSVDVGGRSGGGGGAGFPARRSQFRPGIYPINFCSVEWQRARQFGSAFAILTLQNSAGHEEAARFHASRGSHRHHRRPSSHPPPRHSSLSVPGPPFPIACVRPTEISSSSCSSVPDYVAEYTSG